MARRHVLVLHKCSLYHLCRHSSVSEPPSPPTSCSPFTFAGAALSHAWRKNVQEECEKLDIYASSIARIDTMTET